MYIKQEPFNWKCEKPELKNNIGTHKSGFQKSTFSNLRINTNVYHLNQFYFQHRKQN